MTSEADAEFVAHRPLLFSIAYEITGSVADAEDVVQESYVRWQGVELETIENRRAYLARIAARQALGLLRSAARRHETYTGPWLPEPLATDDVGADGLEHVLTGEAVTTAMLLVLENLTPRQRVAFVLRDVFAFDYAEIARALESTDAAVRQLVHRSRARVRRHPRRPGSSTTEVRAVMERFSVAAATGDVRDLVDLLAPDAVYLGDGGGLVSAAQRPVHGADQVARLIVGLIAKGRTMGDLDLRFSQHNALPSILTLIDGTLDSVTSVEISGGVVTAIYTVRNPHKLDHLRR